MSNSDARGVWRLAAASTHLYPGASVVTRDGHDAPHRGSILAIEFDDGAVTSGTVKEATATAVVVEVAPYRTARGTAIARKVWTLGRESAASAAWKVTAKGAAGAGPRREC